MSEKTEGTTNAGFGVTESLEQKIERLETENAALRLASAAVDSEQEGKGPIDAQGFPEEYVYLTIFAGRDKQDLAYVPLGIGGYVVKVSRGVEVIIPKVFVTECLEHAVEDITTQSEGGLITRPALRFPYSVRGPATKEAYQAFQAKNRAQDKAAAARA